MEQYLSEIRVFGFNQPPRGWALCNGQILSIAQNQALFSLLGTTYGGNGVSTFALPNLMSRTMLGTGPSPVSGANYVLGEIAGVENVTLLQTQIPQHIHIVAAQTAAGTTNVTSTSRMAVAKSVLAANDVINAYATGTQTLVPLEPRTIGTTGGTQPHNNMPPFLVMNICIATQGIFPSRN
ncbi:phage tail protein [Mucilaginibacter sp. PPCGB 2223]|uniref:phage tail protein n=1 Tax=Mucilaginibacter sp. PPCGB 2223 TaxID=1886027 RepID=UPI00082633D9|nr:tail fiber protein [Mucilaginibacter sp. PPCGB 2223]OCX53137.1 phage tail protein [Mucilaginibacter sp. PPCGB 2223]